MVARIKEESPSLVDADAIIDSKAFALPNLSVQLAMNALSDGDSDSSALFNQVNNNKLVEIGTHVGSAFSQSMKSITMLEKALWEGDIIPPVHPGAQTCLAELVSDKRALGDVMGNVDALVDEHESIAGDIAAVGGTAAAANILSTQVDSVVDSLSRQVRAVAVDSATHFKAEVVGVKADISSLDRNLAAFKVETADTITSAVNDLRSNMSMLKNRILKVESGGGLYSSSSARRLTVDGTEGFFPVW